VRVKDINPGAGGSNLSRLLTVFNNVLYFSATDGTSGQELWKTDGTEAGTVRVKDINPGAGDSTPSALTAFNNALYFTAKDSTSGVELWKTDGTEAGTVRVKDISPGVGDALTVFSELAVFNNALYFSSVTDGVSGHELWKTDGTEAGTVRVKDINSGVGDSNPFWLTAVNNVLYFSAIGDGGRELWKTDGTEAGTVRVKDINPAGDSMTMFSELTVFNNALYFSAKDGTSGDELWKTDGTEAGTVRVKDINPGVGDSNAGWFTVFNGAP
jgi:ELWxxDGT repeat protein